MEKKQDEEKEDDDPKCIYCDKRCDVIIWNGRYGNEDESIYLCDRCNRHLERPDTRELQALRIVSQRDCTDLASGGQSFFDRKSLSALSVVLDEDNGKDVEKALEWVVCDSCEKITLEVLMCDYEECEEDEDVESLCRDCIPNFMEEVDGKFYHSCCEPIEWQLNEAFEKFGFSDGNSNRCYTGDVAEVIERLGYEVECDGWGMHNYVIIEIKRIEGEEIIYDELHLGGYDHDRTFANTLPQDICQALWDYQQECDIEGFYELDREFFFG